MRKKLLVKFFGDTLYKLLFHQPCKIQQFDARNGILFQIKVLLSNIKETVLASCFIKVAARPSFTR